jgi:hypothetical protein
MKSDKKGCSVRTLSVISPDPSALCGQGFLKLTLEKKVDGKLFLELSSSTTILVNVQLKKSWLERKSPPHNTSPKKRRKKRNNNKKKKRQKNALDRESALTSPSCPRFESKERNPRRGRKKKDKKTKRKKQKKKEKKQKEPKNEKRSKKGSKSSRNNRSKNARAPRGTSSVCSLEETFTIGSTCPDTTLVSTSKRGDNPSATAFRSSPSSSTSSTMMSSSISLSDLRSPLAWEKRRQELTKSNEGSMLVSAISLSNPSVTMEGYLLGKNHSKLKETLIGGAFVYISAGKERKMMQWQKRFLLARQRSSLSDLKSATPPPVSCRESPSSFSSAGAPINVCRIEASYPNKDSQMDSTRSAVEPKPISERNKVVPALLDSKEKSTFSEASAIDCPTTRSPTRGELVKLNTLRQIQEWEAIDDHFFSWYF